MANRTNASKRKSIVKNKRKSRFINHNQRSKEAKNFSHKTTDPQSNAVNVEGTEDKNHPITNAAQITLRPISREDQGWIMQVTKEEMGPIFKDTYGYELNLDNVLQYVYASQTRMIMVNDQLAGYVSTTVDDGGKLNIGTLVITGGHKRRGYGTRILKLIEQEARSMSLIELEAFVQESNHISRNFLKKLGFQEVPSMQSQTIVMVKRL